MCFLAPHAFEIAHEDKNWEEDQQKMTYWRENFCKTISDESEMTMCLLEKTGTKVFLIAFKSFFLFNDSSLKSAILPEEHLRVVNVADAVMRLFVVVVVAIPN